MKKLTYLFCIISSMATAQQRGIIPFTGATYYSSGISFKEFEIELDEKTWISNRLPINKQFSIKLIDPIGFHQENEDVYPGVEVLILNPKGDTLGFSPNIFGDDTEPMNASMLKNLSLLLTYNEMSKVGDTVRIIGKFYDKKSPNFVRIDFPMIIVAEELPLQNTNSVYGASSYEGYNAKAAGVEMTKVEAWRDSTFMPNKLFHNIRLADLGGLTKEEAEAGKMTAYLYDENLNLMTLVGKTSFFVVKSMDAADKINMLAKIPLQPMNTNNVEYTARMRWESADGLKVIDVMSKISK